MTRPRPSARTVERSAGRAAERGQSTVELALALPVVAVLLLALLQVGLVVRDHAVVGHAAREAARAAAVDPDPGAAARAAAAAGLDPELLDVVVSGRAGTGSRVTVTVRYASPTDVPLVGAGLGDVDVVATATMRVE